jgi:hypothetical protein
MLCPALLLLLSPPTNVTAGTPAQAADAPAKAASGVAARAGATWDTIKDYSIQEKTKAVAAGKKLIAETDKKIAELAKPVKNANAETRAAHAANMQELKEKKAAAQAEQGCVSPLTFGCVGPLSARHLSQTGTGAGVGWP